jgi:transposase
LTKEPSCKDEARIGQKNGRVRQWARRGSRPRQPADQRYENAYLFGAICPARGTGAALALPYADTFAMQLHLDEISRHVAKGAHAVLLLDRAGWHTTAKLHIPNNITPIFLPSRAPELNPVENIWQYLRSNWLSNRVFDTYDAMTSVAEYRNLGARALDQRTSWWRLQYERKRSIKVFCTLLVASFTACLASPASFSALPFACWASPSASNLSEPVTLPVDSLIFPTASFATPETLSAALPISISLW